jgi:hypothetical protein
MHGRRTLVNLANEEEVGASKVLGVARNAAGKRGKIGGITAFWGAKEERLKSARKAGDNNVKGGRGELNFGHTTAMLRVFTERVLRLWYGREEAAKLPYLDQGVGFFKRSVRTVTT